MQETQEMHWSLGGEDPLEKEMTTHSSILAWEIPWTEEPGGRQSKGLQTVRRRHDLATKQQQQTMIITTANHDQVLEAPQPRAECRTCVGPAAPPSSDAGR